MDGIHFTPTEWKEEDEGDEKTADQRMVDVDDPICNPSKSAPSYVPMGPSSLSSYSSQSNPSYSHLMRPQMISAKLVPPQTQQESNATFIHSAESNDHLCHLDKVNADGGLNRLGLSVVAQHPSQSDSNASSATNRPTGVNPFFVPAYGRQSRPQALMSTEKKNDSVSMKLHPPNGADTSKSKAIPSKQPRPEPVRPPSTTPAVITSKENLASSSFHSQSLVPSKKASSDRRFIPHFRRSASSPPKMQPSMLHKSFNAAQISSTRNSTSDVSPMQSSALKHQTSFNSKDKGSQSPLISPASPAASLVRVSLRAGDLNLTPSTSQLTRLPSFAATASDHKLTSKLSMSSDSVSDESPSIPVIPLPPIALQSDVHQPAMRMQSNESEKIDYDSTSEPSTLRLHRNRPRHRRRISDESAINQSENRQNKDGESKLTSSSTSSSHITWSSSSSGKQSRKGLSTAAHDTKTSSEQSRSSSDTRSRRRGRGSKSRKVKSDSSSLATAAPVQSHHYPHHSDGQPVVCVEESPTDLGLDDFHPIVEVVFKKAESQSAQQLTQQHQQESIQKSLQANKPMARRQKSEVAEEQATGELNTLYRLAAPVTTAASSVSTSFQEDHAAQSAYSATTLTSSGPSIDSLTSLEFSTVEAALAAREELLRHRAQEKVKGAQHLPCATLTQANIEEKKDVIFSRKAVSLMYSAASAKPVNLHEPMSRQTLTVAASSPLDSHPSPLLAGELELVKRSITNPDTGKSSIIFVFVHTKRSWQRTGKRLASRDEVIQVDESPQINDINSSLQTGSSMNSPLRSNATMAAERHTANKRMKLAHGTPVITTIQSIRRDQDDHPQPDKRKQSEASVKVTATQVEVPLRKTAKRQRASAPKRKRETSD